jgi:ornithine cyclodeaminase
VTVFDSVGFALEDYAALRYVLALALARGIGEDVALVPPGRHPKDLFGRIGAAATTAASNEALAALGIQSVRRNVNNAVATAAGCSC